MQRTLSVGRGLIYRAGGLNASQIARSKRHFHQKVTKAIPGGLGEIYRVTGNGSEKNAQFLEKMIQENPEKLIVFCESTVIASDIRDYNQRDQTIKEIIEAITNGQSIRAEVTLSPGHIAIYTKDNYISHSRRTAKNSKDPLSSIAEVVKYDAEQYDKRSAKHETTCYILVLDPAKLIPQPMDIAVAQDELHDKIYDVSATKINSHNCATAVTGWSSGALDIVNRSGMNPLACLYNLLEWAVPIDSINEMRVFMREMGIDRTLREVSHAEAVIRFGSNAQQAPDVMAAEEISHETPMFKI